MYLGKPCFKTDVFLARKILIAFQKQSHLQNSFKNIKFKCGEKYLKTTFNLLALTKYSIVEIGELLRNLEIEQKNI